VYAAHIAAYETIGIECVRIDPTAFLTADMPHLADKRAALSR
jgi:hypothetical protein